MARDELTQGMALTGNILLGNHEVIHTNGLAPITSFRSVQANRVGSLGSVAEPCPEQCLRHQWNTSCQGTHER
jgi:hypothetical protein